jgi:hypothetical protein|tara:strand:+ start:705 stop:1235 length:531 start_codon:yes stop_codon:yes gene_type:complete
MEKLKYKIKNGPRVESLNQFELTDGTIVAIFQGFRGENPELDFIVKYKEPTKRLRTPSHTHWIVDLIVKGEVYRKDTLRLVEELIEIYDNVKPFQSTDERDEYQLVYAHEIARDYSWLDGTGSLSLELIGTLVELFSKCEKQTTGAFMFKSMLTLAKDYLEGKKDYYQIIGTSKRV